MKVTLPEIMHGLGRLLEIYARPRHLPEDTEALAKIWQRELGDVDAEIFRAGVSAYCRTDADYFPKPGVIRKLGTAIATPTARLGGLAAEYWAWEDRWPRAPLKEPLPCPVCGAIDGWAMTPPAPRRGPQHDAAKHAAAGVPFIGWAAPGVASGAA